MRIMMMHIDIVHRNARLLRGADYGSSEAVNLWFDPLISQHDTFAATLRKNHADPVGPLLSNNMPGYRASGKYKLVRDPIHTSVNHFLVGAAAGLPQQRCLQICPSVIKF